MEECGGRKCVPKRVRSLISGSRWVYKIGSRGKQGRGERGLRGPFADIRAQGPRDGWDQFREQLVQV